MKKEIAIYIHVPFCVQKCYYCDFLSKACQTEEIKQEYVNQLCREISYRSGQLKEYKVKSVFIGGGTPTVLSPALLFQLADAVKLLPFDNQVEFTIEANPGTLREEHLDGFKALGVNRVSLGLQSSIDRELKELGRIHNYQDFVATYELLRNAGFDNINVDLMMGIPKQSVESYHETLERIVLLNPEHISAYSLIIEEGTPFYERYELGELLLPEEEMEREMYHMTKQFLEKQGYHRYEFSNFAKKDYECAHNKVYWKLGEYLGLGLGASSYFQGKRFSNQTVLNKYLKETPEKHTSSVSTQTRNNEMEEYMFLGLRMEEGVCNKEFSERFGQTMAKVFHDAICQNMEKGLLQYSGDYLQLTERGIEVSNVVLADFLLDDI